MSETLNCVGLKGQQPVLRIAIAERHIPPGTLLEVIADCPEFPDDIEEWCTRQGKELVSCAETAAGRYRARIKF